MVVSYNFEHSEITLLIYIRIFPNYTSEYSEVLTVIMYFYRSYYLQRYAVAVYDAVYVYTRALHNVLKSGGDPRNGAAIIEHIRGLPFNSTLSFQRYQTLDQRPSSCLTGPLFIFDIKFNYCL